MFGGTACMMAAVQNEPPMRLHSKSEMKRLLYGLTPTKAHNERIRAYGTLHGLLEQIGSLPQGLQKDLKTLWLIIQQDITSSNEEIAVQSLRVLGIILRLAKLTDNMACNFLRTLLALITTTNRKRICALGLWCVATQELSRPLLVEHLKMILAAVGHGIDNQRESLSITHEGFQALRQLTKQLPQEMREHSVSWVPPVYRKLLSWKTSDLAEKCLSEVQNAIIPPTPGLMEAVVSELQLRLLAKMKSMLKGDERDAVNAVRVLSWLIKLLGKKFLQEKALINEMLQVLEISFTSPSAQVRNASQVAWLSLIDAFVSSQDIARPTEKSEVSKSPSKGDQSFHKRLKLLMTPLVTTIRWEVVPRVQRNCFCTWIYLLCKLGVRVNELSEFDTAVYPMLETVFKIGPKRMDGSVWATCVDVFKSICSRHNPGDPGPQHVVQTPDSELNRSPSTPVGHAYGGVLVETHLERIPWGSLRLDRVAGLLRLFKLLWLHWMVQSEVDPQRITGIEAVELRVGAALGCWRLLVQGVKAEEKISVRPSGDHVTAVHLLLHFFSWACKRRAPQGSQSTLWQLAEILIEVLQPVILTSSFYKVQVPLEDLSTHMMDKLVDSALLEHSVVDMVTPVVYISAVCFDLMLRSDSRAESEDILWRRVKSLAVTSRSGFDVMGTFHGLALTLDCLGKRLSSLEEESPGTNVRFLKGDSSNKNWSSLLNVWRMIADQLSEHLDRTGDVPLLDVGAGGSDYKVPWTLLLYPIKFLLCLPLHDNHETGAEKSTEVEPRHSKGLFAISDAQVLTLETTWFRLYESVCRISSCKPSSSNAFIGGFFSRVMKVLKQALQEGRHSNSTISPQCLNFLADVVIHALEHTEVPSFAMLAISKKRRKIGFGATSVRVQYLAGVEAEDHSHLRDLLILASTLLTLSHDSYELGEMYFNNNAVVSRLFLSLAGIAQQTTSQSDALRLMKVLSQPFMRWLGFGSNVKGKHGVRGDAVDSLQDFLAQAWDGLLSCLQACHPGLTFDSALLAVQAPTLSLALDHTYLPIAERTISFWEATYGSKGYPLKCPPALVEVLSKLRDRKVEVSLPCWSVGTAAVKQKFGGDNVYSRHPLARFMPQNAGREQHSSLNPTEDVSCESLVETALVSPEPCSEPTTLLPRDASFLRQGDAESVSEKENTSDLAQAVEKLSCGEDGDHLTVEADQVSPLTISRGEALPEEDGSFEDFMSVVNSALKKISEDATSNSSPQNGASVTEFPGTSRTRMDDRQASAPSLHKDFTLYPEQWKSSRDRETMASVQELQQFVLAAEQVVTDQSTAPANCTSALTTPPVTSMDPSPSLPKHAAGGDRDEHISATADAFVQMSDANSSGSNLPRLRKKLRFQDESSDIALGVHDTTLKTSAPQTVCEEVQILQKTPFMEKTSGPISELQSCGVIRHSPVDASEVDLCLDRFKENEPPSVLPDFDFRIPPVALKQAEVPTSPNRSLKRDSSTGLRSSMRNLDLVQMKERLATLLRHNPYMTFREFVRSEQLNRHSSRRSVLPRRLLIKLKQHFEDLKTTIFDDMITVENGGGTRPGQQHLDETQDSERENAPLSEEAMKRTPGYREEDASAAEGDSGQGYTVEDASAASPPEQELESSQLSLEVPDRPTSSTRGFYVQNHSRPLRSKRILDLLAPRAVSLRSSGKLRGGRHWRIDAEVGRACVFKPGSKKRGAKRRRSLNINSIPRKDERAESARLAGKELPRKSLTRAKAHISELAEVNVVPSHPAVPYSKDYLQFDDDSGFRIRQLHCGMFGVSYGASEDLQFRGQEEDAEEMLSRAPRPNHSRKCRFPKRVHLFSGGHHKMSTPVTEAMDPLDVDGSLAQRAIPQSPLIAQATELDEVVREAHNEITPPVEERSPTNQPHFLRGISPTDRQKLHATPDGFSNAGIPDERRVANGVCANVVPVFPRANEADGRAHTQHATDLSDHTVTGEIQRILLREDVRVYHLLEALVTSPEWITLSEMEVVEAEKHLSKISQMLSRRKGNEESPKFVTPPTHFTSFPSHS